MGEDSVGTVGESIGDEPDGDEGLSLVGFVNCDETIARLYSYLDGELTEARRVEIARHLDLCGPCVEVFGFELELRRVIANRCKDRVPDTLRDRVAGALHEEELRQRN